MKKKVFIIMVLVSLLAIPYYFHSYFCRLLLSSAFAAQSTTIAVAAADKTPGAAVTDQAGSAPYFLVFDQKGKFLEALENPYKNAESPGPSIVNYLAGKGATVMVGGGFGPKIVEVMKGKGITAVSFKGSAQDAVKKVLQSK
jgi:predicted Fe-Mo cluster-binding NifX family protein